MPDSEPTGADPGQPTGAVDPGADTGAAKPGEPTQGSRPAGAEETPGIQARIARLKKQHAKELEDARAEAIALFREENGIDDPTLKKIGEGRGEEAESKREIRSLKAENTKLKNQLDQTKNKADKRGKLIEKSLVVDVLLREAAGKFVDPQDAVLHLRDRFRFDEDDDSVFIVDEKGEPSTLTPGELVEGLLKTKPHLAMPTGLPGAGSRVSSQVVSTNQSGTKAKTAEERRALLRQAFPES